MKVLAKKTQTNNTVRESPHNVMDKALPPRSFPAVKLLSEMKQLSVLNKLNLNNIQKLRFKAFGITHCSAELHRKQWYLIITTSHDCGVIVYLCNSRFRQDCKTPRFKWRKTCFHTVSHTSVTCLEDLFQTDEGSLTRTIITLLPSHVWQTRLLKT